MNRFFFVLFFALVAACPASLHSQTRATTPSGAVTDPAIRARILQEVRTSGMNADQIRTRLKSLGYSDQVIDQLVSPGSDSTALSADVFAAVRDLGLMDSTAVDSLRRPFQLRRRNRAASDSALLDSIGVAIVNDTVRAAIARILSSPAARVAAADSGFSLFGREVFNRQTTQFDPAVNGPLPPDYRIGFGDQFTLILTGDVARTEQLSVTRDGWAVLQDVGQVPAANLTFEQLRSTLASRLGNVYSGIRTGTTRFSVLPTRLGTNQVFVLGDVKSPNAYQISRLGTVLTALYAAGGPNENGDARSVDVRRNDRTIATMDLYDYLLAGSSASDVRLENGDVVFVRSRGPRVRVSGAVVRPATYELKVESPSPMRSAWREGFARKPTGDVCRSSASSLHRSGAQADRTRKWWTSHRRCSRQVSVRPTCGWSPAMSYACFPSPRTLQIASTSRGTSGTRLAWRSLPACE